VVASGNELYSAQLYIRAGVWLTKVDRIRPGHYPGHRGQQ
jgi:hypothetical protein